MKKLLTLALVFSLGAFAVGCGGSSATTTPSKPLVKEEHKKDDMKSGEKKMDEKKTDEKKTDEKKTDEKKK
ncbi:MAG TPA: hypothetical protein VGJ05_20255 [Fimbriiglobus sp.]|jgi:hypothetical protein